MLLLLTACATVYKPAAINLPMLQSQGDLDISLSYGHGTGVMGAYALTDHVSIRGDAAANANPQQDFSLYRGDLGIGFQWAGGQTPEMHSPSHLRLGGSLDLGLGHVFDHVTRDEQDWFDFDSDSNNSNFDPYTYSAWVDTASLQGFIGAEGNLAAVAFVLRGVGQIHVQDEASANYKPWKGRFFYVEPALVTRVGWSPVYFEAQFGMSLQTVAPPNPSQDTTWLPIFGSVGITFDLEKIGAGGDPFANWNR